EYDLAKSTSAADNVTKENLENLVRAGENLLEQPVKVIDVNSFDPHENQNDGTNAEALESLAEILHKEKQLRLEMKAMEKMKLMKKMGRPFVEAI
ncbi:patatin-like phospholipase, partial [Trifolium medium]|nr:patatin-like phospholipase [Trifolium medium]